MREVMHSLLYAPTGAFPCLDRYGSSVAVSVGEESLRWQCLQCSRLVTVPHGSRPFHVIVYNHVHSVSMQPPMGHALLHPEGLMLGVKILCGAFDFIFKGAYRHLSL